jgi:citrate lyase subunit beta/citryl-CoA lyase
MVAKAAASDADLAFLDLEDAVAAHAKVDARGKAVSALTRLDWGRSVRAVRVNGLDTPWCHDDIIELVTGAGDRLDTLIIPKVRAGRDVWWVDVLLTQLETKLGLSKAIRLEVLIEDVEGLANADAIATASPRVDALVFGAGDLSVSQGARVDTNFAPIGGYPGDFWHYARSRILVAARIAGVEAIDAPYPDFHDPDGYRRAATQAAALGFSGKWAIHPSQIEIANEVFSPTAAEIALAERNIAAYRDGEARGLGAVGVDGMLVDAAHVKLAEIVLERARQSADGSLSSPSLGEPA